MKKRKYLVYGISLMIVLLIGLTYAYFSIIILGEKKKVTVNTTDLRIVFDNGDDIEGINVEPGWSITKTFSVENKTNYEYKYNLVFKDLINTFVTKGYLVYKITSTDGGYNMTEYVDIPKSNTFSDAIIEYSISIASNKKHNYTIELKYINDVNVDQGDDMGKELSANIYIESGTEKPILLSEAILRDNPTISERTDFSVTNVSNTTGTIYKTNKTEDGSDVYYYSGNTTKNWIKFGDFYWKIIRTNEDGSVRLLYSGTSPDTIIATIGSSVFNNNYDDAMYVGYMYGTSGSLENNRTNENDSTIKTFIDTWYENNLLNKYDKFIGRSAIYCNDRSYDSSKYSYSSGGFYYSSHTRLSASKTPTYKCGGDGAGGLFESIQAIADKFSASTSGGGNGQLRYPIALMTADEVVFAGGNIGTALTSPYAWFYTNSLGESIMGVNNWWVMSPYAWRNSYSGLLRIYGSNNPGYIYNNYVNSSIAVRPVISLKACVNIKSGNGTVEKPYELYYEGSCN